MQMQPLRRRANDDVDIFESRIADITRAKKKKERKKNARLTRLVIEKLVTSGRLVPAILTESTVCKQNHRRDERSYLHADVILFVGNRFYAYGVI